MLVTMPTQEGLPVYIPLSSKNDRVWRVVLIIGAAVLIYYAGIDIHIETTWAFWLGFIFLLAGAAAFLEEYIDYEVYKRTGQNF